MKWWTVAAALALLHAAFFWLSRPVTAVAGLPEEHVPDPANGERLFRVGGCASCHAAPDDEDGDPPRLGGGMALETPYGTFSVPNISPDPRQGIGRWSSRQFFDAMQSGVAPDGRHYYPSFPYPSYARMKPADILDLKAYLDTLPPVSRPSSPHELGFPYSVRRAVGIWKRLFLDSRPVHAIDEGDEVLRRGRYLVEGPGHCGECHTPRNALGGMIETEWLRGAPSLDGVGRVPDISNGADGLSAWSQADVVFYLKSGIDPEFDVVGGSMVAVQENLAHLPEADLEAIAAYLKSLD